jgi:Proto-chlorophyllide reductase 57 kD subunit
VKASQAKRRNAVEWTTEAEARLKEIPFFVRPAARKKIEKLAQEVGATQITIEVYEQAKQKFGS